jgi:predicted site-specific integrase-resolvase
MRLALEPTMCDASDMSATQPIGSKDTCTMLGIDRSTLSRWVAAGKLKPVTQLPGKNGAFVFRRADVEALREEAMRQAS